MFYTFVFVIASINHLINVELCSFYSPPFFSALICPFLSLVPFFRHWSNIFRQSVFTIFRWNRDDSSIKCHNSNTIPLCACLSTPISAFLTSSCCCHNRLLRTWNCGHKLIQTESFRIHFLVMISREFSAFVLHHIENLNDQSALTGACMAFQCGFDGI